MPLDLDKRHNIKTTWFTPEHTVHTFPDTCARVRDAGHEFGCHGYYHENPTRIARDTEQRLMTMAIETWRLLGLYNAPWRICSPMARLGSRSRCHDHRHWNPSPR